MGDRSKGVRDWSLIACAVVLNPRDALPHARFDASRSDTSFLDLLQSNRPEWRRSSDQDFRRPACNVLRTDFAERISTTGCVLVTTCIGHTS